MTTASSTPQPNSIVGKMGGITGILIVAAVILLAPLFLGGPNVYNLARGLILATVAMSFCFLAGYVGLLSLAQVAFFGVSGYTLAIATAQHGWSWGWAVLVAVAFAVVFSIVFGFIARNATWLYFLMMGLAMVQIIYYIANMATTLTGGHDGITKDVSAIRIGELEIASFGDTLNTFYYIVLAVFALCYVLLRLITKSPFGIALQGVRDNSKRMASLGYNVSTLKHVAIVLSSVFAALAGALWVFYYQAMSPDSVALEFAVSILFISLLGGTSRIEGGIIGAVVFVFVDNYVRNWTSMHLTVLGAFFVLVIIFLPDGLLSLRDRFKRSKGGGSRGQDVAASAGAAE